MKHPFLIGLTGGIGAGKSLVLEFLRGKGVPVLQTDYLGHQLLSEKALVRSIVQHFGKGVLGKNGKINRQKLGQEVFRNAERRTRLNRLLHPEIRRRVQVWVGRQAQTSPEGPLVVEVPLLFETGFDRFFDGVLCVSASSSLRRKRLLKRGWSLEEIKRRENSQWTQTQKNNKSDWVIFNRNGRKELKYAVNRWLKGLKKIKKS